MPYEELLIQEETLPVYTDPAAETAQNIFGVPSLYPWQRLVIANITESAEAAAESGHKTAHIAENTEQTYDDIYNKGKQIVLLPTGAGKSLCFMVPAMLFTRPTLILYPLLALMADQLRRMHKANIEAAVFRGQQSFQERELNFKKLESGAKIILATPEVLQSSALTDRLKQFNIIHAAIDEAHCIAEWGDSFRPAYAALGSILKDLKIPVITAFTATASPPVLERIQEVLFSPEKAYIMRSASDRQNISYRVRKSCAKQKTALLLAAAETRPIIIFCGTRSLSENTAHLINALFGKGTVRFYHAGLTKEEKKETEEWFYPRTDAILCCTCAFGMGIDKPDIRTVIHLGPPDTIESYIQEAGRAGRDGKRAQAILLWSPEDALKAETYPLNSRKRIPAQFAESETCRRQVLLDALEAEQAACGGCDICEAKESGTKIPFRSDEENCILSVIARNKNRWTAHEAACVLSQKMNTKSRVKIWEPDDFMHMIRRMLSDNTLREAGLFRTKRLAVPARHRFQRESSIPSGESAEESAVAAESLDAEAV